MGEFCFSKQPPNNSLWDGGILTKLSPTQEGEARNPNSQQKGPLALEIWTEIRFLRYSSKCWDSGIHL